MDAAPPPPVWRDPWAWVSAGSVIPLLLRALGAPLGEPVAEDFDFLHRTLLEGRHTLLDGGGSMSFWRPVAHQAYYELVGPLLLRAPGAVAALHVLLLALGALLLYRLLRPHWPGPSAAVAASFPLLAESTRTLVSWPSHFVDLGLFLFSVLALHEAARRRLWTALTALLAALFCKELAVVTGLMLPWIPETRDRGERRRWILASAVVLVAWGAAYVAVRRHAGLALPHDLENAARIAAAPLGTRLVWSTVNSLRAIFGLTLLPGRLDAAVGVALGMLALATIVALTRMGAAGRRLRRRAPWMAWGVAWFVLSSVALMTIYPLWAPNRSQFGSVGLGIALAALLDAAHPALLAALVGVRLALLGLSPGPPAMVTDLAPDHGAFMDFERLARLQRLMRVVRTTLHARFPTLRPGSAIAHHHLPNLTLYAFGGSKALQVWYRDSTLVWEALTPSAAPAVKPARAIVEYEPSGPPQITLVDPVAMDHLHRASLDMQANRWTDMLAELALADSTERDPRVRLFRAQVAGKRSMAQMINGHHDEAQREAQRSLAIDRNADDARLTLAVFFYDRGDLDAAQAQLDTLFMHYSSSTGRNLQEKIWAARKNRSPFPAPGRP
jgi:hypothetical protein